MRLEEIYSIDHGIERSWNRGTGTVSYYQDTIKRKGKEVGAVLQYPMFLYTPDEDRKIYYLVDPVSKMGPRAILEATMFPHGKILESDYIRIDPKYMGQQLGYGLYVTLLRQQYQIMSGMDQSVGGQKLWIKLVENSSIHVWAKDVDGSEYPVNVVNNKINCEINLYSTSPDTSVNNRTPTVRLMAESKL